MRGMKKGLQVMELGSMKHGIAQRSVAGHSSFPHAELWLPGVGSSQCEKGSKQPRATPQRACCEVTVLYLSGSSPSASRKAGTVPPVSSATDRPDAP